ncbi:MAG: asparagine synthase (glutamine-hydrolyzing) [Rickettsia endosymbiont of Ixodes persulcatus]|nr:asparagine synthase (glutamine-hydrolyzing) [Rickettsia endosymbiont of Ixodes persulcatus]MCZ6914363.1 asparagine synthase (glutamine-hydrolyzing) [Rickettsia endosymbiont of Ixodes persulcatus]
MCGIAGIIDLKEKLNLKTSIEAMKLAIRHRGPDEQGTFLDESLGVALGHQRLSILDMKGGKQPFISIDGQIILVFNGEIYNYLSLRDELMKENYSFVSNSDTETIIYAYKKWGVGCLSHLRGMFAFALWDKEKKIMFCARDRLGIKPFYFFLNQEKFIFSSEVKSILASGRIESVLDPVGLEDYLTFQFCLGEKTLFKEIKKLQPGYFLTIRFKEDKLIKTNNQYWEINYTVQDNLSAPYYIDRLRELLGESIKLHLQSDVPLGAHLSGGLDSSSVVCLSKKQLKETNSFKTFTGKFSEIALDESRYANIVAKHVGSHHHEISFSDINLAAILPELIYFMDEPAAGPGLIPQYYVSKYAVDHVKVVLGGQGGDELFIGYARYLIAYLAKCLSNAISGRSSANEFSLGAIAKNLALLNNYKSTLNSFFEKGLFGEADLNYFHLVNRKQCENEIYMPQYSDNKRSFLRFQTIFHQIENNSLLNKMLYFDLKGALPALLQVEDRMSMAVSLESRVPFLDHRIVEFSASIPDSIKFSSGKTKHILRHAVKNILPKQVLNRKDKMGFPVPLSDWFYGKQKSFIHDTLFSKKSTERGIVNINTLKKMFKHKKPITRSIWGALCLELWFVKFVDAKS